MNSPDIIPPPPQAPQAYECCDSGCGDLCVFEIYRLEKAAYDVKYGNITQTPTDAHTDDSS